MRLIDDPTVARDLDARDALAPLRDRFFIPPGTIYLDGNSLGLASRDAESALLRAVEQWRRLGIDGWTQADPPWYYLGEELGRLTAPLIGADPATVLVTGTTTTNLHALVSTFYQPQANRRKIVAAALDFPSDHYALASQVALHGGDPARDLVLLPGRDGRTIPEPAIISAFTDDVALAVLPSALYRSGQVLNMRKLTAAAHERGIVIGFDCAHSVGALPHAFDDWEVDFAFWCGYKYLNGGPGSAGGIYVNQRHAERLPAMRGWWGYDKVRQFDMAPEFVPATGVGRWQISTPSLFAAAPLFGSLHIFAEAGIKAIRKKSLALTDYLMALVDDLGEFGYTVGTPRQHTRRGGHVAVEHAEATRITRALKARGVIPDFRPPNVIRLAPIALYTSFQEVWQAAQHLRAIIVAGEHLRHEAGRDIVA
jgi:kynureninase